MSDRISQWHNSAGGTISSCGSRTSATARFRGNNKYLEAASNISSACSTKTNEQSRLRNKTLEIQNFNNNHLIRIYVLQTISVPDPKNQMSQMKKQLVDTSNIQSNHITEALLPSNCKDSCLHIHRKNNLHVLNHFLKCLHAQITFFKTGKSTIR